jgi:hypothetical protein
MKLLLLIVICLTRVIPAWIDPIRPQDSMIASRLARDMLGGRVIARQSESQFFL